MNKKLKIRHFLSMLTIVLLSSFWPNQSPALAQTTGLTAPNSQASPSSSYNWAGYVVSGGGFSSVSGSWTIPAVPAANNLSGDAAWVGIGGINSEDLIQAGTQAVVSGSSVTYQAWYELLPGYSQTINMTVNPGDSVSASVTNQSGNQWSISLRDNTNGQNFQTVVPYNSSLSTAEWVEEMPSQGNGAFIPLDNFGNVQFSNGSVIKNGQSMNLAQSGAQTLTMLNATNQPLATVSPLGGDGASFTVSRTSAAPSSSRPIPFGQRGYSRVGHGVRGFMTLPGRQERQGGFGFSGFGFLGRFSRMTHGRVLGKY